LNPKANLFFGGGKTNAPRAIIWFAGEEDGMDHSRILWARIVAKGHKDFTKLEGKKPNKGSSKS